MRTGDFNSNLTSEMLNESMFKKFGKRVNFERYSREQLENYRNVLRTEVSQMENTSGFNDLLANESYQQNKHMLELLNVRIKEMLGESAKQNIQERAKSKKQQQAAGIALAAKKKGTKPKGKGAAAQMANMPMKELEKFASTPHKGLPVKKKKQTKISENIGVDPAAQEIFDKIKGTPNLIKNGNPTTTLDFYIRKYLKMVGKGESDIPMLKAEIMTLLQNSGLGETRDGNPLGTVGRDVKDKFDADIAKGPFGLDLKGKPVSPKSSQPTSPHAAMGLRRDPVRGANDAWEDQMEESLKSKKKPVSKRKPDYLDFDKDGDKTEPMKKALADKKKKKGFPPVKKAKKKSKVKESQLRHNFKMILEGIRYYIAEDEEGKAMDITAGADMVKDFTSWMQRLGQYQTKSTIELADSIRSNFGPQEAEQFKSTVTPAIESALEALTASREIITKAVSVLAGEEQPDEMMGEPEDGEDEEMPSFEPDGDSMNVPPEEGGEETGEEGGEDQFAASDAASAGRELRENRRQRQLRKLYEANSIMRRLAG